MKKEGKLCHFKEKNGELRCTQCGSFENLPKDTEETLALLDNISNGHSYPRKK